MTNDKILKDIQQRLKILQSGFEVYKKGYKSIEDNLGKRMDSIEAKAGMSALMDRYDVLQFNQKRLAEIMDEIIKLILKKGKIIDLNLKIIKQDLENIKEGEICRKKLKD